MRDLEPLQGLDRARGITEKAELGRPGKAGESKRRRIRMAVALSVFAVSLFLAAPHSSGQCPLHVPVGCQQILNQLNSLTAEKNDLSDQLKQAAGSQKSSIAAEIKKLIPQIAAKKNQLDACASAKGKKDLFASFSGVATTTTSNSKAPGPFKKNISIGIKYLAWLHDQFLINNFPAIPFGPFDTPIGSNTTTVTLISSGCGDVDPKTGRLSVTLSLHFHESLFLAKDSDLAITVSTENPGGSQLNSTGQITLVGDSKFTGGFLDGDSCHMIIKGTLLPLP